MQLSIIIVNFKSPELTVDCLATVYGQTRTIDFEVILVDNNSADNSRELICESYPEVQWIAMDYNAGFARANNAGIRRARGEVILLLNSDTLNVNSAIENCFLKFIDSTYVACGVQLLNTDGTPQISGNYVMKGGLNHLLPLPYVGKLIRWAGNLFSVRKPNVPDASDEVKVDWINGAFLMVRKSAIDRAGVLDEDFFLYAEEAEWCSRLRKVGEMCIYGQFKVVHLQGASADKTFQSRQKGEVGSSAMPHKVNPIDFENAEGNLGIANAVLEYFSAKLPVSRLQRDLTDSTVLRNIGVPFAHTVLAFRSLEKGLDKLILNESAIDQDLENNWAIVAEAIQTILRKEEYPNPYEALKELTRKNSRITRESIHQFINGLNVSAAVKKELKKITPHNYTGVHPDF